MRIKKFIFVIILIYAVNGFYHTIRYFNSVKLRFYKNAYHTQTLQNQYKILEKLKEWANKKGEYPDSLEELIREFPELLNYIKCPNQKLKNEIQKKVLNSISIISSFNRYGYLFTESFTSKRQNKKEEISIDKEEISVEIDYEYIPGYKLNDKPTVIIYEKYPMYPIGKSFRRICVSADRKFISCPYEKVYSYLELEYLPLEKLDKILRYNLDYFMRCKILTILAKRKYEPSVEYLINYLKHPERWILRFHIYGCVLDWVESMNSECKSRFEVSPEESTFIVYWALEKITGEKFGRNKEKWIKWWKENKEKFKKNHSQSEEMRIEMSLQRENE